MNFTYHAPPFIRFGQGVLKEVGTKANELGATKAFIVTSPGMQGRPALSTVLSSLKAAGIGSQVFTKISPDPPIEEAEESYAALRDSGADLVIGLGGGSAMDVAKITAMMAANPGRIQDYFGIGRVHKRGLPTIMAPTTAGTGSEVSPDAVLVDRQAGTKKAIKDSNIIPSAAFVDPETLWAMSPLLAAITGADALTHAIEAYTSLLASPMSDAFALQAAQLIAENLREAVKADGVRQRAARVKMALGSLTAGLAFGNAGTAAVHACAYPLSGMFGVPHGMGNGLMLPYVTEFNLYSTEKYKQLASIFGVELGALPGALKELIASIGLPTRLTDLKIPENKIPEMAEVVLPDERHLSVNPRAMGLEDLEHVFRRAL